MVIDFERALLPNTISSLIVIAFLMVFLTLIGFRVGKMKPTDKPKGIVFIMIMLVDLINNFIKDFYGKNWRTFAPILTAIFLYLAFANTSSLWGLATPLASMTIALSFSLLAFFIIQISGLVIRKPFKRLKALSSPNILLLPLNLVGEFSTPLAMGLRLFGNLLSGSVMAVVIYNLVHPVFSTFITVGILHPIFNIGFGLIQAMVFFMLLSIFLSMAIEDSEAV